MRPPVFLVEPSDLDGDMITLRGQEGRHASTVRRLTVGERADLTDGQGTVAECMVAAARPGELQFAVLARRTEPKPDPWVCVIQAIPKGERGELAVELLTEVGADVIVPWAAERCVAVWRAERAAKSTERWRTAAVQAAKQSRRAWLPEVTDQVHRADAAARIESAALAILLDPGASESVAEVKLPASGEIVLIVGPEGGITPAEEQAFRDAGAVGARIGPTVLRASSAGVVAAGVVLSRTARWA